MECKIIIDDCEYFGVINKNYPVIRIKIENDKNLSKIVEWVEDSKIKPKKYYSKDVKVIISDCELFFYGCSVVLTRNGDFVELVYDGFKDVGKIPYWQKLLTSKWVKH